MSSPGRVRTQMVAHRGFRYCPGTADVAIAFGLPGGGSVGEDGEVVKICPHHLAICS